MRGNLLLDTPCFQVKPGGREEKEEEEEDRGSFLLSSPLLFFLFLSFLPWGSYDGGTDGEKEGGCGHSPPPPLLLPCSPTLCPAQAQPSSSPSLLSSSILPRYSPPLPKQQADRPTDRLNRKLAVQRDPTPKAVSGDGVGGGAALIQAHRFFWREERKRERRRDTDQKDENEKKHFSSTILFVTVWAGTRERVKRRENTCLFLTKKALFLYELHFPFLFSPFFLFFFGMDGVGIEGKRGGAEK